MSMPSRHSAKDVLVVVDVQNDFCEGGSLAVPGGNLVVPVINRLTERFSAVVAAQDWHRVDHKSFASAHPGKIPFETIELDYGEQILWPDHCVQGTIGAEFHPELEVERFDIIVRKGFRRHIDSYSAFFENDRETPTGLDGYCKARGFERAYLCGLAGDFCVFYSAMDAAEAGFETFFVEDACRDIDMLGSKAAARQAMHDRGITIVTSESTLRPK